MRSAAAPFWQPDRRFAGRTVYVLGGGPSLRGFVLPPRMAPERVIAVNSSWRLCPNAGILFFHDYSWFRDNREVVATWPGDVVTVSRKAQQDMPEIVKRVEGSFGRPLGATPIRFGASAGQTAASLGGAMGGATVALLGFDMGFRGGRSHHHDDYRSDDETTYRDYFGPAFDGWAADAAAAGFEIVNATPASNLTEFPTTTLEAVLAADH